MMVRHVGLLICRGSEKKSIRIIMKTRIMLFP
jgi:hypothetical protein